MNAAEALEALENTGAIQHGHFLLSSGLHSDIYIQCARLLQWPSMAERFGHEMAVLLKEFDPQVVLSPALGGLIIGHEVARHLGTRMIFAERQDSSMAIRRSFELKSRERVAVIEDVVTTGRSPREVIGLVNQAAGEVVCVGSIINRSQRLSFGVPFRSLVAVTAENYNETECPSCSSGLTAVKPGSRTN